jgi:hypothetical protein
MRHEGKQRWPAPRTGVEDGIDTFVFRDGLIRVQTVRYTLQLKG